MHCCLMGIPGRGDQNPMLEKIIAKARHLLKDVQLSGSVESVAVVEQMYNDIVALNEFICKELSAVESNSSFDAMSKKAAKRSVFEKAGRKLESIKSQKRYAERGDSKQAKASNERVAAENISAVLQFLREKEVRDRLCGMTEKQIQALFGESLFDGSNPLLLNAILNSPTGFEPVSREILKKMHRAKARKGRPAVAEVGPQASNLSAVVEEMFSLVKKKLDDLRRNELPSQLVNLNDSKEPPFKF